MWYLSNLKLDDTSMLQLTSFEPEVWHTFLRDRRKEYKLAGKRLANEYIAKGVPAHVLCKDIGNCRSFISTNTVVRNSQRQLIYKKVGNVDLTKFEKLCCQIAIHTSALKILKAHMHTLSKKRVS